MKNNLENIFKESLQDFEMPYNAEAWSALSSKLDAKLPTTTPKSNFKWYAITGTAAVAVTIGAYFYFSHNAEEQGTKNQEVVQTTNPDSQNTNVDHNNSIQNDNNSNNVENVNGNNLNNYSSEDQTSISPVPYGPFNPNSDQSVNGNHLAQNTTGNDQQSNTNSNDNSQQDNQQHGTTTVAEDKIDFNAPAVHDLCANEKFEFKNDNNVKLWILGPQDNDIHVKPMANGSFSTDIAGTYQLGYFDKKGFVEEKTFRVIEAPFVDFEMNLDQKFENGIPVTKVSTDIPGTEFVWNFGRTTAKGRNAEAHFFSKGNHDITLTVTGSNGCTNTKTESIFIDYENGDRGNYNLLAVNAINLRSADQRNNSFMPEGLKYRDARFKMIIYSMEDGHKVFETNDPTNPWRGVDQSTGQTVTNATTYYWEVILENPLPGENSKYKGSLTVLLN